VSLLKVAALVVVAVVLLASPASAHGGGSDATNFRVDVLEPGYPGLSWRTYGGDALIELTNRTGSELTLSGYEDEPYLQFRPGVGVFENTRSPATYLNQDRYAGTIPPATADPGTPAQWRQVASGDRYAWHDHRVHWMSPARPAMVDACSGNNGVPDHIPRRRLVPGAGYEVRSAAHGMQGPRCGVRRVAPGEP